MKAFAVVAVVLFAAGLAQAKEKKPVVCVSYTEATANIEGKPERIAICSDAKKPFILHGYSAISMRDENGETIHAIVGWR